jgi:hypothetical protein
MTIDVQAALEIVAQSAVAVAAIVAGFAWLKKWLRTQVSDPAKIAARDSAAAAKALSPDHGESTHDYAKQAADLSADALRRLDEFQGELGENRRVSLAAYALAVENGRRLDAHLLSHHHIPEQQGSEHAQPG